MSKFNNDVLHAREIQEQYLAHNINTVEKLSEYNPKTKCRYFAKVNVDPQAQVFKKKFLKTRISKKAVENNTKVAKPEARAKPPKKAKVETKSITNRTLANDTLIDKVYKLHLKGIRTTDIAEKMSLTIKNVSSKISRRKTQLGLKKQNGLVLKQVGEYYNSGMNRNEIAKIMNRQPRSIAPYITEIRKQNELKASEKINVLL